MHVSRGETIVQQVSDVLIRSEVFAINGFFGRDLVGQ
jgi:hypothetical protein